MNQRRRRLITSAVVLTSIGCLLVVIVASLAPSTVVGSLRPSLRVSTLDGPAIILPAPYGRPLVLTFFLVSCPHCRRELEHLRRIVPLVPSLDFIAVSLSGRPLTRRLVDSLQLPFPVVLMDQPEAARMFGFSRVPTLVFVDRSDSIVAVRSGVRLFQEDSLSFIRFSREGVVSGW